MSTMLSDLFDGELLAHCLAERLVVARRHPSAPLTILNYTERCQYERGLWNPVTLQCRGLIHNDAGEVVARPFRKFFNHGQSEAGSLDLLARCVATDKLDGSLGILYPIGDFYAIATRGAFESEQAQHATWLWDCHHAHRSDPTPGWTFLFEIIYPTNRIVIDYGDADRLVLLGAVDIASGRSVGPVEADALLSWDGPRADVFAYATVADALAAPPRPNAEGLVLHLTDTDDRVKIKQADYVALHRIVTGLNERTVWEHLKNGGDHRDLCLALPDEFHGWVDEVAARLLATVERNAAEVERAYSTILATLPPDFTRKDFALAAKDSPLAPHLFARRDGKDYRPKLWDAAQPPPRIGPRAMTDEATA